MKAKVIIENGQTKIDLTPENDFEIGVVENVYGKINKYDLETNIAADYSYGSYGKHRIEILIKEKQLIESK